MNAKDLIKIESAKWYLNRAISKLRDTILNGTEDDLDVLIGEIGWHAQILVNDIKEIESR